MEIKVDIKEAASQAEADITASAEDLHPFIKQAIKSAGKKRPIKGFRPGAEVPAEKAFAEYGTEAIMNIALERALPKWIMTVAKEHDLHVIGRPAVSVSKINPEEGAEIKLTLELVPKIKLGDPSKITVKKEAADVTEDDVKKEIEYLAKQFSDFIDIMQPAQKGNTVIVDFKITDNGQVVEHGESKNHPVHIGEGHFIPGFEDKLIGISAGDNREFDLELNGKQVHASVHAHAVKKRVIPELNDEFAGKVGKFKTMQELSDKMKTNLEAEKTRNAQDTHRAAIIEELAGLSEFPELPQSLISGEIDRRLQELGEYLQMQQKSLDSYLKDANKTLEDIKKEIEPEAIKSIKQNLALLEFAKTNKIDVTDDEVAAEVETYLSRYDDPEKAKREIDTEDLATRAYSVLRNNKALQKLEETVSSA